MSVKNKKNKQKTEDTSPGALLRKARAAKELSIEDISTRLRLGKDVIEALENNKYDQLPAPIFVRGYIKSYASMVGIDVNQVMDQYNQQAGDTDSNISLGAAHVTPPSMTAIKERKKKWLPAITLGVFALLGLAIWLLMDTDTVEHTPVSAQSDTIVSAEDSTLNPTLNPVVVPEMQQPQVDELAPKPLNSAPVAVEAPPETEVNKQAEANSIATAAEVDTGPDEAKQEPVKQELDQLVLVFNGDSWVDVSDATGKRLIYRMLKSGQQRSVAGKPPFKLTLGNAPEINLTRNGETVDLTPYTRGKVAKFRLGKINE